MLDSEFFEKHAESGSELPTAIRTDARDGKRRGFHEIEHELHARSDRMFRVEPREHEPRTIVDRVVLCFPSALSKRKARVYLDFSSGHIESVEFFPPLPPFSLPPVTDARSPKYSKYRGLIENHS